MLYRKACSYLYEVSSLYFAKIWTRVGQNVNERWTKGGQMDEERTRCEKNRQYDQNVDKMWTKTNLNQQTNTSCPHLGPISGWTVTFSF